MKKIEILQMDGKVFKCTVPTDYTISSTRCGIIDLLPQSEYGKEMLKSVDKYELFVKTLMKANRLRIDDCKIIDL